MKDTYNQWCTNSNIKPLNTSDKRMLDFGFLKYDTENTTSWLYIEPIHNTNASVWVEIWDNNICIELLSDETGFPYNGCKKYLANLGLKKVVNKMQKSGIIVGYNPNNSIWQDIYVSQPVTSN